VTGYGFDEFLDRGGDLAGTRVLILCRIVTDIRAIVGRIDGHFTRNRPGADARQQQAGGD
jgi:hypothetical protein